MLRIQGQFSFPTEYQELGYWQRDGGVQAWVEQREIPPKGPPNNDACMARRACSIHHREFEATLSCVTKADSDRPGKWGVILGFVLKLDVGGFADIVSPKSL